MKRYKNSFIAIMPAGSKHFYKHQIVENLIYKSMLFRDMPTPKHTITSLELLWFASACSRMIIKLSDKSKSLLISFRLAFAQRLQVFLRRLLDFHKVATHKLRIYLSSSSTLSNLLPGCSLASSTRAKNSSFVISAESAAISFTTLRRYLATRANTVSSSAITPRFCKISAFNTPICEVVMT